MTKKEKIEELLTRGVEEVIILDDLRKKLESGKKLRVKFGIDPTGSDLHIGHSVPLRKLRQFQDMGHQVILLIGDFTAKIGDPSGRNQTRPVLSDAQIRKNMKTYIAQAGKILDIKKTEVRYNSEWYKKKKGDFIMQLSMAVTVPRILDRDDFKRRMQEPDSDLNVQEILYPLLQGYDSVELKADVEIGGNDQKFNLLMGRRIQKRFGQKEQDVTMLPILEGLDGVRKMSKSYGNYIPFTDTPEDMYGKAMSVPDALIYKYFELATDVPRQDIEAYRKKMQEGENPRNIKMKLAHALTRLYHGEEGAEKGEKNFIAVVQQHEAPTNMATLHPSAFDIVTVLVEAGFCATRGDARRAIEQGGVHVNDVKVSAIDAAVSPGNVVKKGKRFFVKIV